jgi:hypothetical protein
MTTTSAPNRLARPAAAVTAGLGLVAVVAFAAFPRAHPPSGQCRGATGPATAGARYAIALQVQGDEVASTMDFDGRLWRAVDGRVDVNGLVPAGTTELDGAATLVNREQATFSSPGAFATFLPLTRADSCASFAVARSGPRLQG